MPADRRLNLAAIDIGTNTIKMAVASADPATGAFDLTDKERLIVRLGSGSGDMDHIGRKAFKRGISALKHLKMIADADRARIRAVATSAVREAGNRADFIAAARQAGVRVETISGAEEARLIFLGVSKALDLRRQKTLLLTIGGGSTELLVGRGEKIYFDRSLKLGAVRLTERFFRHGRVSKGSVKKCREYIRGTLAPVIKDLKPLKYDLAVASSGTFTSAALMIGGRSGGSRPKVNGFSFTLRETEKLSARLIAARTVKERRRIKGLEPDRADIIVAGALIIEELMRAVGAPSLTISDFGLREGLLFDTLAEIRKKSGRPGKDDVRSAAVGRLVTACGADRRHGCQVARLATQLFDQLEPWHRLGADERSWLAASAMLHDIGFFVSHSQHHKHSYYLIRNSELLGFSEDEKEIVANIARYHRKGLPKIKHEPYAALPKKARKTVRFLAAILRIADGLDRNRVSCVRGLKVTRKNRSLIIRLRRSRCASAELDIWGAQRKQDLLERVTNRKVIFV